MASLMEQVILRSLAAGPATLAGLRAQLPAGHPERRAAPSMGEPDEFGGHVADLVRQGLIVDEQGVYRLPEPSPPPS